MDKLFPDKDDITWGGFIKSNVRNAVIDDCLSSGDPENMFRALSDVVEELWDEVEDIDDEEDFWEKKMEEWRDE